MNTTENMLELYQQRLAGVVHECLRDEGWVVMWEGDPFLPEKEYRALTGDIEAAVNYAGVHEILPTDPKYKDMITDFCAGWEEGLLSVRGDEEKDPQLPEGGTDANPPEPKGKTPYKTDPDNIHLVYVSETCSVERHIVCAANMIDGLIICGARHHDEIMRAVYDKLGFGTDGLTKQEQQGFIDQYGQFVTRKEAAQILKKTKQKLRDPELTSFCFSENLY